MGLTLSDPIYVQFALGSIVLMVSFVLLRRKSHTKLNEPPLVPYKYPIIGHTIEYYKNNSDFIKKCQENYGDIFSLYVLGSTMTFVGKEPATEVFKHHQKFDFGEAANEMFPMNEFMNRPSDYFDHVRKVIQINLARGLKNYSERIQRQLIKSVDITIGDGKVLDNPMKDFQFIIAKPIAATLVGEELSEDKELVNTFAYATADLAPFLSIPPILSFIHPNLHKKIVVLAFRLFSNKFKEHREFIKRKITPVIEKRLSEMKSDNSYTPPIDILQQYIELFCKDNVVDIEGITDYMIGTIFASVHTTSENLTYCLQEFLNNPKFHKEILEEQEQFLKNNESSYYSVEQIDKLEKLDSFIRETLRYVSHSVTLPHKTVVPYFTFSNGYQVPKGRLVYIRSREIHFDEKLQGQNSNEFDALRHLKGSNATRPERNYLVFGLGKHACPGRFFAINEIKVALQYLLSKYNIRNINNENFEHMIMGPYKSPSSAGLIFEKKEIIQDL